MQFSTVTILILLMCSAAVFVQAEIPQMISYQGKVTDSSGMPVADGNYIMRFQIYDAITGGSPLWDSAPRMVSVSDGIFDIVLGQSPQDSIDLPFDQDYWLEITIGGDVQTPRSPLGSTPYAYMASGLVPGTQVNGLVYGGAIEGINTATTAVTYGLYGESSSPSGNAIRGFVDATNGNAVGVMGISMASGGSGIGGSSNSSVGYAKGVYGISYSTDGTGVYACAASSSGDTYGVWAETPSNMGVGVYGLASATSGFTYGVYGKASTSSGYGVYGIANAGMGTATGVYGRSYSEEGRGVYGYASATWGTACGVYGKCDATDGFGMYFEGGVAGSGSKSCVVRISKGPVLMYSQESPECWFEDFGEGQLNNGRCHIDLDPEFLETVTINADNPMKVFVELNGKCEGIFVVKGSSGFDVVELHDGVSNVPFDYRVVAKRNGFEQRRLDYCKAAESDSYLYPELHKNEVDEEEKIRMNPVPEIYFDK